MTEAGTGSIQTGSTRSGAWSRGLGDEVALPRQGWERAQLGTSVAQATWTSEKVAGRWSFYLLAQLGVGLARPEKGKRAAQHEAVQEASQVPA